MPKRPNNRVLAERRLQLFKKRFLRDSGLFEKYKATFDDYMIKGHAKRVPEDELVVHDKLLWYLLTQCLTQTNLERQEWSSIALQSLKDVSERPPRQWPRPN